MIAETSLAAYRTLELPELELRVLNIIRAFGANGCTVDEIVAKHPEIEYRTLSPRFAPLERKGLIYRAGDTREGVSGRQQKIMRDIKYSAYVPKLPPASKPINGFDKGIIYCAKMIAKASDLSEVRKMILAELEKIKEKT